MNIVFCSTLFLSFLILPTKAWSQTVSPQTLCQLSGKYGFKTQSNYGNVIGKGTAAEMKIDNYVCMSGFNSSMNGLDFTVTGDENAWKSLVLEFTALDPNDKVDGQQKFENLTDDVLKTLNAPPSKTLSAAIKKSRKFNTEINNLKIYVRHKSVGILHGYMTTFIILEKDADAEKYEVACDIGPCK